ncbi:MAG: hypothetical protein J3K34DRAFT_446380 [Monoraphidium minutum]|nr:MAG: hypothetical protein J3K34DRAFT_446380 [Monoraphidium minutum]
MQMCPRIARGVGGCRLRSQGVAAACHRFGGKSARGACERRQGRRRAPSSWTPQGLHDAAASAWSRMRTQSAGGWRVGWCRRRWARACVAKRARRARKAQRHAAQLGRQARAGQGRRRRTRSHGPLPGGRGAGYHAALRGGGCAEREATERAQRPMRTKRAKTGAALPNSYAGRELRAWRRAAPPVAINGGPKLGRGPARWEGARDDAGCGARVEPSATAAALYPGATHRDQ